MEKLWLHHIKLIEFITYIHDFVAHLTQWQTLTINFYDKEKDESHWYRFHFFPLRTYLNLLINRKSPNQTSWRPGIWHVMNSHRCPEMSILRIVRASLQGVVLWCRSEETFPNRSCWKCSSGQLHLNHFRADNPLLCRLCKGERA